LAGARHLLTTSSAIGNAAAGGWEEGFVGGGIDEPFPTLLLRLPTDSTSSSAWRGSSDWIVQWKGYRMAWSWDLQTTKMIYSAAQDPEGLAAGVTVVVGPNVYVHVGGLHICGIMSWNADKGLQPFLRWYGDTTRGASNFGTDGKDMVWTYSEGAKACDTDPPKPEVWTAPYTIDPAEVKAKGKRVRSDVRGQTSKPYEVGFGFAVRTTSFGSPMSNGMFVVRLSDGFSWVVPGAPNDADSLSWGPPLGVTQDEVFTVGSMKDSGISIYRIRLDSLGPGTPPD
jgi:hypothetical protein